MIPSIIVCCASSIATSTMVATSLRDILAARGIQAEIVQSSFSELPSRVQSVKPALILATGKISETKGIPVVIATPFLTGIGKDKTVERILEILASKSQLKSQLQEG